MRRAVAALLVLLPASTATAEVIHLAITSREPFAADVAGKVGPYERLRGRVVYALDPAHEANRRIVDLAAATPNEEGRVEFYADLEILAPVDRGLAQPTVLYVVNNRGRLTWGPDPFLLARGYVTVSSGWIAEVPPAPGRLRLEAPIASDEDNVNVVGTVRAELVTDRAGGPPAGLGPAQLRTAGQPPARRDADPAAAREGPAAADCARPMAPARQAGSARGGQRSRRARGRARRRLRAGRHPRVDLRGAGRGGAGRGGSRPSATWSRCSSTTNRR